MKRIVLAVLVGTLFLSCWNRAFSYSVPSFGTNSLEEYSRHLESVGVSDSFISYDAIRYIGDFLWFYNPNEKESPVSYQYDLIDPTGTTVHFSVEPIIDAAEYYRRFSTVTNKAAKSIAYPYKEYYKYYICNNPSSAGIEDTGDLRFNEQVQGCIHIDEICYSWQAGKLTNIRWRYLDFRFLVSFEITDSHETEDVYPLTSGKYHNTFASRLLNAETAGAAIQELMESCFPDEPFTGLERIETRAQRNRRIAFCIGGGVLGITAITVPTILLLRRRKKTKQ